MGRSIIPLDGKRFGKLTVLYVSERRSNEGKPFWYCVCDCGNETEVLGNNLKMGLVKSCGCARVRAGAAGQYYVHTLKDLTGQHFGRWTVLGLGERRDRRTFWTCECACGTIRDVAGNNLRRGMSTSCGCYHREKASESAFKHGLVDNPLYAVWVSMKDRCSNPNNKSWRWYGGKGIQVCPRWTEDFRNFWEDMSGTWEPGLTLHRKDSSKGYEPNNCCWVTWDVQWQESLESRARNRYSSVAIVGDLWSKEK
jgi:hypothetical protein